MVGLNLEASTRQERGNSLVVQWLGLRAVTADGPGLIPGQGTKILQAMWCGRIKNPPKPPQKNKKAKSLGWEEEKQYHPLFAHKLQAQLGDAMGFGSRTSQ